MLGYDNRNQEYVANNHYTRLLIASFMGGSMVLGKLPVSGRPAGLDIGGARAYCALQWVQVGLL